MLSLLPSGLNLWCFWGCVVLLLCQDNCIGSPEPRKKGITPWPFCYDVQPTPSAELADSWQSLIKWRSPMPGHPEQAFSPAQSLKPCKSNMLHLSKPSMNFPVPIDPCWCKPSTYGRAIHLKSFLSSLHLILPSNPDIPTILCNFNNHEASRLHPCRSRTGRLGCGEEKGLLS